MSWQWTGNDNLQKTINLIFCHHFHKKIIYNPSSLWNIQEHTLCVCIKWSLHQEPFNLFLLLLRCNPAGVLHFQRRTLSHLTGPYDSHCMIHQSQRMVTLFSMLLLPNEIFMFTARHSGTTIATLPQTVFKWFSHLSVSALCQYVRYEGMTVLTC